MSDEITITSSAPAAPASPLDNDDLLEDILLRLPPQRSSLRRVSAVCKRWRGLVADPRFLRRRLEPPLLGALVCSDKEIVFTPILDPTEGTPLERFDLGHCSKRRHYRVLDCRHGRVLVKDRRRTELVVCEPITGEQHRVPIPAEFQWTHGHLDGVVLCAATAPDRMHGSCQSSSYKVALMSMIPCTKLTTFIACVYSSETGIWGSYVSTSAPRASFYTHNHGTLTGSAIYLLPMKDDILQFDLDRGTLAMIEGPGLNEPHKHRIIKAEDGHVGLFVLTEYSIQMWHMKVNYQGVTTWLLRNAAILGISPQVKINKTRLIGYDEDTEAIVLHMRGGVYMVQLKSMQCKKLDGVTNYASCRYYPSKSFRPPGIGIAAGCDGAKARHGALG
ncbi:uncharacterized protein [Triticum aestivum]|uniref:uncharacterized protein n=1 Tax=Triticum aestivum TaxID=4565 RepID=UPI001D00A1C6|nr:uncharacterized protein LOC123073617 [Triticum aestivum]